MKQIFKSLLLLSLIFIYSCGNPKEKVKKNKYLIRREQQEKLRSINLKAGERLSNSHNAIIDWDTVKQFTFNLQELLENKPRPISFIGDINDIIKKDSVFVFKVVNSNFRASEDYIAEIIVNPAMFHQIRPQLKADIEGCFIFQVTKINSSQPILSSEVNGHDYDIGMASSNITLDFQQTIIKLQGNLIDYYLYDQLPEKY